MVSKTMGRALRALFLLSLPATALAEDLVPSNSPAPILVRAESNGGVYYELRVGETMNFSVVGPTVLKIYARQKLPDGSGPSADAALRLLGDGRSFMDDLVISGTPDQDGRVLDLQGGTPTLDARADANLSLPGAHTLSLTVARGQHPLLVRIEQISGPPAEVDPWLAEDDVDLTATPPAAADDVDPLWAEPKPAPVAAVTPPPAPKATPTPAAPPPPKPVAATASLDEADVDRVQAGVKLGFGSSPSASRTLGYIGVEARFPLTDHFALGANLGRYGIRYQEELAISLPLGGVGATSVESVDWTTRVRPLELTARYYGLPLGGPVEGWGAVGLAGYSSTRLDNTTDTRVRGVSVGLTGSVGADIPLGPGLISPSLSLNTGRRGYENLAADGDEAREQIRSTRLNAAYLMRF